MRFQMGPRSRSGHDADEALFVDAGRDAIAAPVLFAAGMIEGDALRGNAARTHLVPSGQDVEDAGQRDHAYVGLVLPALQPTAETGGMRNQEYRHALVAQPA